MSLGQVQTIHAGLHTVRNRIVGSLFFGIVACILVLPANIAYAAVTDNLRISKEQILLLPVPIHQELQVIEVLDVVNHTDQSEDLQLAVPSTAAVVQVNGQLVHPSTNHTIVMTQAAKANQTTTLTLQFILSLTSQNATGFVLHSFYDVDTAHVYLPLGQYALSAQGLLTTTQVVNVSGTQCREFTRLGIPNGDDWSMSLQVLPSGNSTSGSVSGLPVIGQTTSSTVNMFQAVGNLVLAAFILVVGMFGIRRVGFGSQRRATKEEAIVQALERLEYRHLTADIDDDTYYSEQKLLLQRYSALSFPLGRRPGRAQGR